MVSETSLSEGKKQPEEHTFAQYSENRLSVCKLGCGDCGIILWLDCIGVVRIAHDLEGLTWIVSKLWVNCTKHLLCQV